MSKKLQHNRILNLNFSSIMEVIMIFLSSISPCFIFSGCSQMNHYFDFQDDNIVEEAIEEVIQEKTGINVDLTPGSDEYTSFKRKDSIYWIKV